MRVTSARGLKPTLRIVIVLLSLYCVLRAAACPCPIA